MTVLMHDATTTLTQEMGIVLSPEVPLHSLLYADDTLLVGVCAANLSAYMKCIEKAGAEYGLALNWKKVEVLPVRCTAVILNPDGAPLEEKESMLYLGAALHSSGRIASELSRRLGIAQCDFKLLSKVWGHSSLSQKRKYEIYLSLVLSRLLYSLESAWLNVAERRKLNGFHARCLRKIAGVAPSFISRVSNETVLNKFDALPLSATLLQRQLCYFGKIARLPPTSSLRGFVFEPDSLRLVDVGKRKRGRPRLEWGRELLKEAQKLCGSEVALNTRISDPVSWKTFVVARTVP
jgi:hypothetical protein